MKVIAYKGRPISFFVDLLMKFYLILHVPSTVGQQPTVISETSRSNRLMTAILNRLMLSDQEDGY